MYQQVSLGVVPLVSGGQSSHDQIDYKNQIDNHKGKEIGVPKERTESRISHYIRVVVSDSGLEQREESGIKLAELSDIVEEHKTNDCEQKEHGKVIETVGNHRGEEFLDKCHDLSEESYKFQVIKHSEPHSDTIGDQYSIFINLISRVIMPIVVTQFDRINSWHESIISVPPIHCENVHETSHY